MKKYSRKELLELLLKVTENNEALMVENEQLRRNAKPRVSQSAKIGSIAEAALRANGYFEAVQNSADEYLREVKQLRDQMVARHEEFVRAQEAQPQVVREVSTQQKALERIQEQAKTYIQDVQAYANNVIARANAQAEAVTNEAQNTAQTLVAEARRGSDDILVQARSQSDAIVAQAHAEAQEILAQAQAQAQALLQSAEQDAARHGAGNGSKDSSVIAPLPSPDAGSTGQFVLRGRHARALGGAGA